MKIREMLQIRKQPPFKCCPNCKGKSVKLDDNYWYCGIDCGWFWDGHQESNGGHRWKNNDGTWWGE